jgi:hypothetical protein
MPETWSRGLPFSLISILMNIIFRRQKPSVYSPSPLSRSQVQADSDSMDDNLDSTQVLYNHVTDRTASPEQVEYEHDGDAGSASTVSPASTLSDADIGYPLERVERVGREGFLVDVDPSWPTSVIGSRPSVESAPNDYMYASQTLLRPPFLMSF